MEEWTFGLYLLYFFNYFFINKIEWSVNLNCYYIRSFYSNLLMNNSYHCFINLTNLILIYLQNVLIYYLIYLDSLIFIIFWKYYRSFYFYRTIIFFYFDHAKFLYFYKCHIYIMYSLILFPSFSTSTILEYYIVRLTISYMQCQCFYCILQLFLVILSFHLSFPSKVCLIISKKQLHS